MFSMLLEKEPSEEDIPEEEAEIEEEEEPPDENTVFLTEEITECFAHFDKNKTGEMETKHLQKALACLGIHLTSVELDDAVENLDSSGIVKFDLFLEYALEKLLAIDELEALRNAFRTFDPENEGLLPDDRFKKWMTTLGDPLTEKEAKELVKTGDPSGKGFIVYNDLSLILIS